MFRRSETSAPLIVRLVGWILLTVIVAILIVAMYSVSLQIGARNSVGSGRNLELIVDPAPHPIRTPEAPDPVRDISVAVTALGPGLWIDMEGSLTLYDGTIVADLWSGRTLTATDQPITVARRIDDSVIPSLYVVITWKRSTRTGPRPMALRAPLHPKIDYQPLTIADTKLGAAPVIPIRQFPIEEFHWYAVHRLRHRYQQLAPRWWLPGAGTPKPLGAWRPRPLVTYSDAQTPGLPH